MSIRLFLLYLFISRAEMLDVLRKNLVFLFGVLIAGICLRTYSEFGFLFMHRELGTNKTFMSLTLFVSTLSECVVYPLSQKIIKRYSSEFDFTPCSKQRYQQDGFSQIEAVHKIFANGSNIIH